DVETAVTEGLMASTSNESVDVLVEQILEDLVTGWKADLLSAGFPEVEDMITWLSPEPTSLPERVFEADSDDSAGANRRVVELKPQEGASIRFANIDPLTDMAVDSLEYLLTSGVKQQGSVLVVDSDQVSTDLIIQRSKLVGDLKSYEPRPIKGVPDTATASALLRDKISEMAKELPDQYEDSFTDWDRLQKAAFELAKLSITDTLVYDQVSTESDREKARQETPPVMYSYAASQKLQDESEPWTRQSRHDVTEYWNRSQSLSQQPGSLFGPLAANIVFVSLLLLALYRAVAVLAPNRLHAYKSLNIMMLIITGTVALGRIIQAFGESGLLIPVAAGAILLTILTNARLAAISSILISVLLSIQYTQDWRLIMVTGAMSFTGIMSIYRVRKRRDMTSATIKATLVGLLVVLAIWLSANGSIEIKTFELLTLVCLNGLICAFLVPGLLSPLEHLFGITTDIQLLEYSDLNNEILNRLAIQVPATYAHSMMMGQLAETACDVIGANGLLARVCAYYHDIGKLRRPEYFSENQTGYNIHDDMSPRLSARAIASHVTEGVELAREFHLPQPIIRGILEHHGNLLISFFYQQALDQQKHGDVREEDFRYPGPKPQSRETAILMICDAVESGVRTIKHPTEDRVRDFVDKIIQSRSADRQFDECDLTLKQLDTIGSVLTKQVLSTHHTRVSYPEKPSQEEASNVIHMSGGGLRR
ncbi:MAG TPA: HDIG domain-containing protein, partial [Candidatus Hydrogenedentes bacterium]|nr:HDIG domain-containing protein [Candidatus Hydrogenedentota bacterium]